MSYVPTKQINDIERAIAQLAQHRSKLAVEKTSHQVELSRIRDKIRGAGLLPRLEYQALCKRQNEIKSRIANLEGEMAQYKTEMQAKEILKNELKADASSGALNEESISAIQSLRDKYMAFAADPTRVSSMRAMAAQFVQELDLIS